MDATVKRNPSRRAKSVTITSLAHGGPVTAPVSGAAARVGLGLRSTWFSVGVLSLQPPAPNSIVASGTSVLLTGVVRGVSGVVVQERTGGTSWKPFKSVAPTTNTGAFRLVVRPNVTTDYRLATAQDAAASVRIRVQPNG